MSGYGTPQTPNQTLAGIVAEEAAAARVDRRLVWAIITNESGFNPSRVSGKGATGLMQLMPQTAQRFGVSDSFNARQNVRGGARYLAFLLDLFNGNATLAIAAYNAGEGAVIKYGRKIPPFKETQEYVRRVSETFVRLIPPAEIVFSNQNPSESGYCSLRSKKFAAAATQIDESILISPPQSLRRSKGSSSPLPETTVSNFLF